MKNHRDDERPVPEWVPHRGMRIRWDRSFAVGDSVFRWHSRLDGSAVLYGPSGTLAIGDTIPMPAGHMHGTRPVPQASFIVSEVHDADAGHVWIKAVRNEPSQRLE